MEIPVYMNSFSHPPLTKV